MSRFGIQQVKINNTLYSGWRGYQLNRGIEIDAQGSDGTVYETAQHAIRSSPIADLTSRDLKTLLALMTTSTDFPCLALDGTNGMVMYGARSAVASYDATAVHVSRVGLRGLLFAAGVRWAGPGSKAEMAIRAMFKSNVGTTQAVTDGGSVALPAQPAPDQGWTLSALNLNGSPIKTVNSCDLSFDPKFAFDWDTGLPEPVDIIPPGPGGQFVVQLDADVGDIDLGQGTGAVSAVYKRYAHGGGFASDQVTHTLSGNYTIEESFGGDNGAPMSRKLKVRTRHDGTTKPWACTIV